MTEREALKLALEAFEEIAWSNSTDWQRDRAKVAITCIKEALAQPEQELTTTLEASVHAGLDKKNDKNPQVDHQGKQPEQEPVAWRHDMGAENGGWEYFEEASCPDCQPLYTTPPQRTWVGLTDEEICPWFQENTALTNEAAIRITRAIEAKLKEKNNG